MSLVFLGEVQVACAVNFTVEQKIVAAAKTLITLYNQKIRTTLAEVWGDEV